MTAARRCAVLGSPIGHSLSPVLHRAAYDELGLDWSYDAVEVTEEALPGFLDGLGAEWRGLSLTMPLKRTVVPLVDEVRPQAARAGAGNTLLLDGGRRVLDNTDVPGAGAALRERYDGPVGSALVLGGGATATSVLLALADLGCRQATVAVREPARAEETLAAVARDPRGLEVRVVRLAAPLPAADVLVSTIPAAAQEYALLEGLRGTAVVFEVVYDPWVTPVARWAQGAGLELVGGLDLLVHQAVLQVSAMTGRDVEVAVLRRAGERALAAREVRAR